jgi:N utilization substance protein A
MSEHPDAAKLFMETLGASESAASCLVRAGFTSIEELAYVPFAELLETTGIDQNVLMTLRERACAHRAL